MTLDPILNAPLAVQIHVFTVIPALVLGACMLALRKGTYAHKLFGHIWVALMAITALASFFIHDIRMLGPFSPIHLLSILTLFSCGYIIWTARMKRFSAHRKAVLALYWGGAGLAGAFTLVPGRIMNRVVLDNMENVWPVIIAIGVLCVGALVVTRNAKLIAPDKTGYLKFFVLLAMVPSVVILNSQNALAAPGIMEVVRHTPIWVWPLLLALLFMGWMHSRDRVVAKFRLLIQPVVFVCIGAVSFLMNGASLSAAIGLLLSMAVGAVAGQRAGRRDGAWIDADGMVHVPGEWISMGLILMIFASRFIAGAAQGIDPAIAGTGTIAVPMSILSGFIIGFTGMRALVQTGFQD